MRGTCLMLSLMLAISACTPKSASKYNDTIITEQEKVMQVLLEFGQAITGGEMQKAEDIRKKGVEQTKQSIDKLEDLGDFQGNTEFRDAALNLVKFYHDAFSQEYKDVVEIVRKETNMTPDDYVKLADIEKNLTAEEKAANKRLLEAQTHFAKEHNFSVEENAMQKDIDEKK